MALDPAKLAKTMLDETVQVVGALSPATRKVVERELRGIADTIAKIEADRAAGVVTESAAKRMVRMQTRAAKQALITGAGLAELEVEKALNAALAALREPVKTALGWALV
jgi:hypothetical protein